MNRTMIAVKRIGSGTDNNPYRPDLSDFEQWQDATGQPTVDIINGMTPFTVEAQLTDLQLANIQPSLDHVVLWSIIIDEDNPQEPPVLNESELDALRTEIEKLYYSDVAKLVTLDTNDTSVISNNLIDAQMYPSWIVGISVESGEVYQFENNLYKVIQGHTTQVDWNPIVAKSLFKRFYQPSDDPWEWVQPFGAHDAYTIGATVLHDGFTWESTLDANVWEPGVIGWTNLTPPPNIEEWQSGSGIYSVGDQCTYQGITYQCIQNPGVNIWPPPIVPALWTAV